MKKTKKNNSKDIGVISVLKIVNNPDGSATMDYEVDDKFIENYLEITGKKKATAKGLNKFVLDILYKAMKGEGEYKTKRLKDENQ